MVAALTGFFKSFLLGLIVHMANLIVDVINGGYEGLIDFAVGVVGMFPDGPALPPMISTPTGQTFVVFLTTLNWVFPVSYFLSLVTWIAQGYILFLFVAPLARLFKLVT